MSYTKNPQIALIIIGNEILSGRTLDKNTQYVASRVTQLGIDLKEVRIIADDEKTIIKTVNELRSQFDYIFTTGGIGPTHDDITTAAIAKAFGRVVVRNPAAYAALLKHYGGEENLNPGRIKMTEIPQGAVLIDNPVSIAPGFQLDNVFVMAGVPNIMQAMLESVLPKLRRGKEVKSLTVQVKTGESVIAELMTDLQNKYKEIDIGSYPYTNDPDHADGKHGTNVVFRGQDAAALGKAIGEFVPELEKMKITYVRQG